MKRLRYGAVLLGLVLAMGWASPAHATEDPTTTTSVEQTTTTTVVEQTTTTTAPQETTTTTAPQETTTTTAPEETTTTTEPGGGDRPCSPDEGLESVSDISTQTAAAHPTASVDFTVAKGCIVQMALVSFTGLLNEPGDFVDVDPEFEEDSFFGPGDHTLTVDLPNCSSFSVFLFGFPVLESPELQARSLASHSIQVAKPVKGQAHTLAATEEPELEVIVETDGKTTNCPTETTNAEVRPTSTVVITVAPAKLPFTGTNALPILIAGLVLVAGGAAAVIASRMRGRQVQ